jgi:uncharacterized delta-60 repeat protein
MNRFNPTPRRSGGATRLLVALAVASLTCAGVHAEPGDLDPGFGLDGRALVDFGAGTAQARAMGRLPDGRIVLAGSSGADLYDDDCAVTVLTPAGAPDPSFGTDGRVLLDFDPGRVNVCEDLVVQPDGRIVLAGYRETAASAGTRDFMVIRLLVDGTLDESFSENGYAFTNFALPGPLVRSIDEAYALALQPDGRIVVAGRAERAPDDYDIAVARFHPDGTPDDGFGEHGRAVLGVDDDGPTSDEAWAVAILDDGQIVLAGTSTGDESRMLAARLTAAGLPDAGFNLSGHRLVEFGLVPSALARGMVIRDDGALLLGGYVSDGETADFAVAALNPDGSFETGFGTDGRVTIDFGAEDGAFAMTADGAGRLLLAGVSILGGSADIAAVRLLPDGTPDAAFGDEGRVVVAFDLVAPPEDTDLARAVLVQPDGSIVLAGAAVVGGVPLGADFAAVRLQGDGGDTLFADGFE